jgi:HK97 family phage portal protein
MQKRAQIVGSWQSMDPAAIPPNSAAFNVAAGVVVNDQSALSLAAVFRAVSIVSESVAQMDWLSYRGKGIARTVVDPQPTSVVDPFVGVRRREGIAQIVTSMLLRGNAYLLVVERDKVLLKPQRFRILHPDSITVRIDHKTGFPSYFLGSKSQSIDPNDIIHIRGLTMPGAFVGLSPIDLAAQSLGVGIAAREYGSRFFAQGVNPSGVIETENGLTEDNVRNLAQRIQGAHGGASNSHLPLILDNGLSWKTITLTADQSQFLATQNHTRSEVATWFGVPPHLLQDVSKSTSWGQGVEDQMIQYVTFTVRSWAQRIEEAWDSEILPNNNFARFDFEELLRGNTITRMQYYMGMRTIGVLNKDEIRAAEDLPPIPDGKGQDFDAPMNAPTPMQKLSLAPAEGANEDSKG